MIEQVYKMSILIGKPPTTKFHEDVSTVHVQSGELICLPMLCNGMLLTLRGHFPRFQNNPAIFTCPQQYYYRYIFSA